MDTYIKTIETIEKNYNRDSLHQEAVFDIKNIRCKIVLDSGPQNLGFRFSGTKNMVTKLVYFCEFPFGTHCM